MIGQLEPLAGSSEVIALGGSAVLADVHLLAGPAPLSVLASIRPEHQPSAGEWTRATLKIEWSACGVPFAVDGLDVGAMGPFVADRLRVTAEVPATAPETPGLIRPRVSAAVAVNSSARHEATRTETRSVAAATPLDVPIPAFARAVRITRGDRASTLLAEARSPDVGGVELPLEPGIYQARRDLPSAATFLRLTSGAAQSVELVWLLGLT